MRSNLYDRIPDARMSDTNCCSYGANLTSNISIHIDLKFKDGTGKLHYHHYI